MCFSHKFISCIWSALPIRKRCQDETSLQILLKYRAHTYPKYWLKMLFHADLSQIMSKDSFQINCNSLLALLFFFPSSFSTVKVRTPLNTEFHIPTTILQDKCSQIFFSVLLRLLLCSLTELRWLNIQAERTPIKLFVPCQNSQEKKKVYNNVLNPKLWSTKGKLKNLCLSFYFVTILKS